MTVLDQLPNFLPWAVAAWLLGIGLYAIVTSRDFVHLIGCLSVVQSSTYVLLLSVESRTDGIAPIFYTHPPGTAAVDPVVHALVLTDVVVGATVTALLLSLLLLAAAMVVFCVVVFAWLLRIPFPLFGPAG